jgi:transcriptional regulator with XRE-family HTH domain
VTKLHKSFDTAEVGRRIKQLRKARSLKQDDLSEVLGGLSRPQISNLECGRRNISLHQAKALADFFGVSLETLGLKTEEVETTDLLERAKLIFENENVPLEEKQELYEEVMKLYLSAKEQIKK